MFLEFNVVARQEEAERKAEARFTKLQELIESRPAPVVLQQVNYPSDDMETREQTGLVSEITYHQSQINVSH